MMGAERWLSLFGRPDVPEGAEQGEIVKDLEHPAGDQRQVLVPCCEERPGQPGLAAAARLRGTAVKLAAAVRSAGVTTAMT